VKTLKLTVDAAHRKSHINRELYGHFIEHTGRIVNDGVFVGRESEIPNVGGIRLDVLEALREIDTPMLHWPGGWHAEFYHWRDGIGEPGHRSPSINAHASRLGSTTFDSVDDNEFGTHEFFDLCEELGAEPYLVMNVGSGTVQEAAEWVEYVTFPGDSAMARLRRRNGRDEPWKLRYLCMGNEWYDYESASAFAVDYRKYNAFARDYGPEPMKRLLRGPQHLDYARSAEIVSLVEPGTFDALTLYCVIVAGRGLGSSTEFTDAEYFATLANALGIDESITRHVAILREREGNQNARLAIDEWGTWHEQDGDDQWFMHITMRDALVQAAVLNIFNQRSDVLLLGTLCMPINALSALLHTSGPRLLRTPAYYVHRMYKGHQGATLVESTLENETLETESAGLPAVSHSVSVKDDTLLITLANCSLDRDYLIDCDLLGRGYAILDAEILRADDVRERNHFDHPDNVIAHPFDGVRRRDDGALHVELPRCSVVALRLRAHTETV
jgi:alpha-N-arabinofuranosidase